MKQSPIPYILVNLVSRRVRQLNAGQRALCVTTGLTSPTEIALREIAECKITAELLNTEDPKRRKRK